MLGLPPIYDELYHLLPAMSLQETGTFSVLDGAYERAALYTRLVAFGFDLAGERSTAAARLMPSVLPGALLVSVMVVWTRLVAGWGAAAVVAVFMLLWPNGIEVSQYVRFYALQGLVFALGALAVYIAVTVERMTAPARAALLVAAALMLVLGFELQQMTLIGSGAVGLWVALIYGPGWLRDHVWARWASAAGMALVAAVLASGLLDDTIRHYWTTYRWEPWPAPGDTTFYHRNFRDNYPTFWPLFPFAALIALRARFVPASFCLVLFAATFVIQTFGGLKNIRYLYPTMPFFFVIWGIAIEATAAALLRHFRITAGGALSPVIPSFVPEIFRRGMVATVLVVSFLFLFAANAAFERSLRMIDGRQTDVLLGKPRLQWTDAREVLDPWLQDGAVLVTTEEMQAVEWLGDYDLAYNKPRFSEIIYTFGPDTPPFTVDFRSGRPIAGEVKDFRPVIACAPVGVFLSNRGWTERSDARALERIASETGAETETRVAGDMSMLAWRRDAFAPVPADCPDLPGLQGEGAAERILSGASQPRIVSSAKAER
jgi:hypothetical protein